MRLTLENIAPFLPYGLKGHCMGLHIDDYADCPKPLTVEVTGLSKDYVTIHEIGRTVTEEYSYEDVFPILRPMDLTKPITIDGKEVIPIVELFKMAAFRDYDDYANNLFNQMHLELEENNWLRVKTGFPENTQLLFTYSDGSFTFKRIEPKYEHIEVIKQLKMFKWLYANFFDVDGLIDAGLAIDVNTLPGNPY